MLKIFTSLCIPLLATATVLAQNAPAPVASATPKPSATPVPALIPFVLPWDDATPSVTNISSWLDAPAGGRGFIIAKDGHLFAGNKRVKLFGVNLTSAANFPTHEEADKIAARLAKFGIGCVRLNQLDAEPSPKGLLKQDRTTIDAAQLEKLDYLIAALKKNGIYVDICLHAGRNYPGMPEWESMPVHFKGVDNFQPRMIEQQRNYARDLLTHVNAYSHTTYANEPAVAFVEINNESSLLREWWECNLDAMPAPYADELRKQWNAWLSAKYGTEAKLRAAWNAHETPAGKEIFGNPQLGGWSEHPQYPTSVKLERIPDKKLFCSEAVEQANALAAKAAQASTPAPMQQASPSSAAPQPKPSGGDILGTWLHVTPGKDISGAQYVRQKVSLDSKTAYTFSFEAKSNRPRIVVISARDVGGLYKDGEVVRTRVLLSPEWQKYSVTFVPKKSLGEAQFGFTELAAEASDWYFADMSLKPAASQGLAQSEKLGAVDILRRREFLGRTAEAQRDWVAFLHDTETKYWTGIARYLKDDLKTRSLVIGTQVSHSPFSVQSKLDVVDVHGYWPVPRFQHKVGDLADWVIRNSSLVMENDGGVIRQMGAQRVAGKPFICTEYNVPAPNTCSSEAFLMLGAYAALQDWDAIFVNGYASSLDTMKSGMFSSFYDIAQHPAKMATLPAAGAMFVRGDVSTAQPHVVPVQMDQVIDQIRKTGPALNATQFGARQDEALRHPVQMAMGGADIPAAAPVQSALPGVTSDTLDLRWNRQPDWGVVTIDTAKSAGVIGYATNTTYPFMQVSITPHASKQNWSTVNLTVVEGDDFQKARRILITATGYISNTNMTLKDDGRTSALGKGWGNAPAVSEGVSATITLPLLSGAKAWALDERGQHKTEVPVKTVDGKSVVEIGPEWKTLWYEIETPVKK